MLTERGAVAKSTNKKIFEERNKYTVYCKCGHSIVFYPFEKRNTKICSWCKQKVYANKKFEFKDILTKTINKKVKNNENKYK